MGHSSVVTWGLAGVLHSVFQAGHDERVAPQGPAAMRGEEKEGSGRCRALAPHPSAGAPCTDCSPQDLSHGRLGLLCGALGRAPAAWPLPWFHYLTLASLSQRLRGAKAQPSVEDDSRAWLSAHSLEFEKLTLADLVSQGTPVL